MDTIESIRPAGTVEVRCSHPGCSWSWYVDALDPRLPGPFHCGTDHEFQDFVDHALISLRVRTGISWRQKGALGPNPGGVGTPSHGYAIVSDRLENRKGCLTWDGPKDLRGDLTSRIEWDQGKWPAEARGALPRREPPPQGKVNWVGYMAGTDVRKYTFVPCSQCGHDLTVDLHYPWVTPVAGYAVGSWGSGVTEAPDWYGKVSFSCKDGLSCLGPQPCAVLGSQALKDLEDVGPKWTMWDAHGARWEKGTSLWYYAEMPHLVGVLTYQDLSVLGSADSIRNAIRWGSVGLAVERLSRVSEPSWILAELETMLRYESRRAALS